ncbi:methyltransferase trm13, partial [Cystoisospora suis]
MSVLIMEKERENKKDGDEESDARNSSRLPLLSSTVRDRKLPEMEPSIDITVKRDEEKKEDPKETGAKVADREAEEEKKGAKDKKNKKALNNMPLDLHLLGKNLDPCHHDSHHSQDVRQRIPCPIDPLHDIYLTKLSAHVKKCTKIRDLAYSHLFPFVLPQCNLSLFSLSQQSETHEGREQDNERTRQAREGEETEEKQKDENMTGIVSQTSHSANHHIPDRNVLRDKEKKEEDEASLVKKNGDNRTASHSHHNSLRQSTPDHASQDTHYVSPLSNATSPSEPSSSASSSPSEPSSSSSSSSPCLPSSCSPCLFEDLDALHCRVVHAVIQCCQHLSLSPSPFLSPSRLISPNRSSDQTSFPSPNSTSSSSPPSPSPYPFFSSPSSTSQMNSSHQDKEEKELSRDVSLPKKAQQKRKSEEDLEDSSSAMKDSVTTERKEETCSMRDTWSRLYPAEELVEGLIYTGDKKRKKTESSRRIAVDQNSDTSSKIEGTGDLVTNKTEETEKENEETIMNNETNQEEEEEELERKKKVLVFMDCVRRASQVTVNQRQRHHTTTTPTSTTTTSTRQSDLRGDQNKKEEEKQENRNGGTHKNDISSSSSSLSSALNILSPSSSPAFPKRMRTPTCPSSSSSLSVDSSVMREVHRALRRLDKHELQNAELVAMCALSRFLPFDQESLGRLLVIELGAGKAALTRWLASWVSAVRGTASLSSPREVDSYLGKIVYPSSYKKDSKTSFNTENPLFASSHTGTNGSEEVQNKEIATTTRERPLFANGYAKDNDEEGDEDKEDRLVQSAKIESGEEDEGQTSPDSKEMQEPCQQRNEETDKEEEKENGVDSSHGSLSHSGVCRKKKRKSIDLFFDQEISLQRGESRTMNSSSLHETNHTKQGEKSSRKKTSAPTRFLVVEREARRNTKEKKDDNLRSISRGKIRSQNPYLYAQQQQQRPYEKKENEEETFSSQKMNEAFTLRQKEDKGDGEEEGDTSRRKKDENDKRDTGFCSEERRKEEEDEEEEETRHVIRLRIDICNFNLSALLRYMILGDTSQLRTPHIPPFFTLLRRYNCRLFPSPSRQPGHPLSSSLSACSLPPSPSPTSSSSCASSSLPHVSSSTPDQLQGGSPPPFSSRSSINQMDLSSGDTRQKGETSSNDARELSTPVLLPGGDNTKGEKKEKKRKEEEKEDQKEEREASVEEYWELTKRLGFKGGEKNMKEIEKCFEDHFLHKPPDTVLGVAKHLCGGGTDIALMCFAKALRSFSETLHSVEREKKIGNETSSLIHPLQPARMKEISPTCSRGMAPSNKEEEEVETDSIDSLKEKKNKNSLSPTLCLPVSLCLCIASCCHHRCDLDSFVGLTYLTSKELGFKTSEFPLLTAATGWATGAVGKKQEIGRLIKRLFDLC